MLSGAHGSLARPIENKSITTQMNMGNWYRDTDRATPKYLDRKTYPLSKSVQHKTHMEWTGTDLGSPQ